MSNKNVDLTTIVDDGTDQASSIQPIGAEAATPTVANRPHENLRVRTETLRRVANIASFMSDRFSNWILDTTSGSTLITYGDTYGGGAPAGNEGRIVIGNGTTDTMFLFNFMSAGEPRGGASGDAATPYENLLSWETFTDGAATFTLTSNSLASEGGHWVSITVVASSQLEPLVTLEIKGNAATVANKPFTPGVTEIVATVSGIAPFHTVDDIRVAILGNATANALVTMTVSAAGTAFMIPKTRLRQGLETVMFSVSGSVMASFFAATNDNLLRDGDTLAVYFADEQVLLSKVTTGGGIPALLSSNLKNISRYIDDSLGGGVLIPICKAFNNKVVFVNGTTISNTTPGKLSLHATSILANALTGRVVTGASPSIQDDLNAIALAFNTLTDAANAGIDAPIHLGGVAAGGRYIGRNTDVALPADSDLAVVDGISNHATANYAGIRAQIKLRTSTVVADGDQGAGLLEVRIAPLNSTVKATLLSITTKETQVASVLLRIPKTQPSGDIDFSVEGSTSNTVYGDSSNTTDLTKTHNAHELKTFSAGGGAYTTGTHAQLQYRLAGGGDPEVRLSLQISDQDASTASLTDEAFSVTSDKVGINLRGDAHSSAPLTIRKTSAAANTVNPSVRHTLDVTGGGVGLQDLGASQDIYLANSVGTQSKAGDTRIVWRDPANAAELSEFHVALKQSGTLNTQALQISADGRIGINAPIVSGASLNRGLDTNLTDAMMTDRTYVNTTATPIIGYGFENRVYLDNSGNTSKLASIITTKWIKTPTGAGEAVLRLNAYNEAGTSHNVDIDYLGNITAHNTVVAWAKIVSAGGVDVLTPFTYESNAAWSGNFTVKSGGATNEIVVLFGSFSMKNTSYHVDIQPDDPSGAVGTIFYAFMLKSGSKTTLGFSVYCRDLISDTNTYRPFTFKITGERA